MRFRLLIPSSKKEKSHTLSFSISVLISSMLATGTDNSSWISGSHSLICSIIDSRVSSYSYITIMIETYFRIKIIILAKNMIVIFPNLKNSLRKRIQNSFVMARVGSVQSESLKWAKKVIYVLCWANAFH